MSCVNPNLTALNIIVKNDTRSEITLTALSTKVQSAVPIRVNSHTQITLNSDILGDIDFIFSYNERKYAGNTGYADDYRSYTILFSEDSESHIRCSFITDGIMNTINRPIDLIEGEVQ
jgi:hypothetical protein